jgi:N-acetyl-beta-hexosaminidase
MLDTARHFLPTSAIYATIDQMAAHKLNTLHLHLTDDQGWRIEIKRYPDLTRIGAWRTPPRQAARRAKRSAASTRRMSSKHWSPMRRSAA